MSWSADQYLKYEAERNRPVRDLLSAIPEVDARIVLDIGCGPGNSTELLAARFPAAVVRGVDSSPDMIAAARRRLPHIDFATLDIAAWTEAELFDVMLANAVLQWVPDHAALLPWLVSRLTPGGSIAVQLPDNLGEPVQRLMQEIASSGPWRDRLAHAGSARTPIASATWYYALLRPICGRVDVWKTIYHHPLAGGASGVVEWFKSTGLRPFLDPLEAGEQADFLDRYTRAVGHAYAPLPDGSVLLPMPRLFIVATR